MAEITVQGRAVRMIQADRATLSITYSAHGPDRDAALAEATERHDAIVDRAGALVGQGVAEKYLADPIHTWSNWAQVGESQTTEHFAQVSVSLVITNIDEVSKLLTESIEQGYDAGVTWGLGDDHRDTVQRELRAEAVADARSTAEDYAAAIGSSVLTLRSLRDGQLGHGAFAGSTRTLMADTTGTEVSIRDIEVSATIEATYVAA